MRFVIILTIFLFLSCSLSIASEKKDGFMTAMATISTGFGYFVDSKGEIVCKAELPEGKHPVKEGYSFVEVEDKDALALVNIKEQKKFSSDDFILWALNQPFSEIIRIHYAAFLDFANKVTTESAELFRVYMYLEKESELADELIEKAIELGAKINA